MKIGIISHSPAWTTGFGVTCNKIAYSMSNSGHDVICLGVGEFAVIVDIDKGIYPFKIWKAGQERTNLVRGFENIKRFPWSHLEKTVGKMIHPI